MTITSTYPHTHGHQIFKGLSAPDVITKNTGAILLVAPVVGPIPADFLNSFHVIRREVPQQFCCVCKGEPVEGRSLFAGQIDRF